MKVTLKDIADATGYSVSTVSRVLTNSDKISSKAKDEILEAARNLNYPLARIRTLEPRNGKLNIALLCDFHEGEFYASFLYGFHVAAKNENVSLPLLNIFNPRQESVSSIRDIINSDFYDGIILMLPELEKPDYYKIAEILPTGFPIVSNALIDNPTLPTFTFDGYSAGYQAANHLYELGHHNLGIVKGPGFKPETRFRYNGFKDFISTHSEMKLIWDFEGNYQFEDGVDAYNNLKDSGKDIDAVFVSNDFMALGFVNTAHNDGKKIPEDIAVIGYDDLPSCRQIKPYITSINTDFVRLGTMSIKAIKSMIDQNEDIQQGMLSFVPVELVQRESTVGSDKK